MTIIAYKDGVLASDSLTTYGSMRQPPGERGKIGTHLISWRGDDSGDPIKVAIGTAGTGDSEYTLYRELINHATEYFRRPYKEGPNLGMVKQINGGALVVSPYGVITYSGSNIPAEFGFDTVQAIGSGAEFAIGAMRMGASAIQAVEVAIEFDIYCGGEVVHINTDEVVRGVEGKPKKPKKPKEPKLNRRGETEEEREARIAKQDVWYDVMHGKKK